MRTREDFHRLIDQIEDETVLKAYFKLIESLSLNQKGKLWSELTIEEREELILSYEESFNQENLLSHDEVKKQHSKWLNG
jgi:hypothetical protein